MTTATMTATTNGTPTESAALPPAAPKAKAARKPAKPAKAGQSDLASMLEQIAALKAQKARDNVQAVLAAAAALHDLLSDLAAGPECPLPAGSVSAALFMLEHAEQVWRRSTWQTTPSAEGAKN